MKTFGRLSLIVALLALALVVGARPASATTYTIDDPSDVVVGGVGDFYLVAGVTVASSPGQVREVLFGPGTQAPPTQSETRSIAMGLLWTTLSDGGLALTDVQKGLVPSAVEIQRRLG